MQNTTLYGDSWLFANPNPFTDSIHIKLIAQLNGTVHISLSDANGVVIKTIILTTEEAEVYDVYMNALKNIPAGNYTITYADSLSQKSIALQKIASNNFKDWMIAYPTPFNNTLSVYINPVETGNAFLRLTDAAGKNY